MTGGRFTDYTYTEYRYKDIDVHPKKGYDDILKYKLSSHTGNKSLLPPAILNQFSFDNFRNTLSDYQGITDGSPPTLKLPDSAELPEIQEAEDMTTELRQALRQSIRTANDYPDEMTELDETTLNPNNDLYVGYMNGIAKLVVEYFMYSSIVYGIMYNNAHDPNSQLAKPPITVTPFNDTQDLNADLAVYVHAMFSVDRELNMTNDVYHAYVADNINFNKMYVKNNNLLKDKESSFNQRKSHLITMMSKNKKIKKQYANRSFWHMIYLIVLIIYILTLVGIAYAGRSDLSVFSSLQKETMGMVLIIISSMVLTGMFLYGIFRRFFKN